MKKLLLLLCAFVASVSGAWGQTELVPIAITQVGETPTLNDGSLNRLNDGTTNGENALTTGDLPLTIYYDLGESKNVGTIKLFWISLYSFCI